MALLFLTGCASKALLQESHAVQAQEARNTQQKHRIYHNARFEYRIAPHDRIQVTVFNHPELGTASAEGMNSANGILVDSAGRIHLALIGSVHIGGLSQPRAASKIQALYGHYLKKSSVHLEVLNKKAFVIGEVRAPGIVKLPNEQISLLQAVASVRGFTDNADKARILVLRKSGRGTKVEVIDLTNPTSLSHANMMINPNDIVYVSASSMKDVAIKVMPIFRIVSDALLPFIRFKSLNN